MDCTFRDGGLVNNFGFLNEFVKASKDIINKKDSAIDLVRIATYIHQTPAAIEMIQDAYEKAYETSVNIMAISKVREEELDNGLEILPPLSS